MSGVDLRLAALQPDDIDYEAAGFSVLSPAAVCLLMFNFSHEVLGVLCDAETEQRLF